MCQERDEASSTLTADEVQRELHKIETKKKQRKKKRNKMSPAAKERSVAEIAEDLYENEGETKKKPRKNKTNKMSSAGKGRRAVEVAEELYENNSGMTMSHEEFIKKMEQKMKNSAL